MCRLFAGTEELFGYLLERCCFKISITETPVCFVFQGHVEWALSPFVCVFVCMCACVCACVCLCVCVCV